MQNHDGRLCDQQVVKGREPAEKRGSGTPLLFFAPESEFLKILRQDQSGRHFFIFGDILAISSAKRLGLSITAFPKLYGYWFDPRLDVGAARSKHCERREVVLWRELYA
ncbi:MAG: hypothetical protein DCC52_02725 [Chloroflexi bacterium]|nr:MAG: hypothetical protein DCC52_02725 [Chloroflexota bacterium]